MNKYFLIAFSSVILNSCGAGEQQLPATVAPEKKPSAFFPVTSFLRGQIFTLDSLPVTPLLTTTIKGKTDSQWLPAARLKPYFAPFLVPVIAETNLKEFFQETRFNDQTLNAITFTYDPATKIPDSISLRHWDVYVDPDRGTITKVYLVKEFEENNQRYTQQLTWQTDQSAKISTILNTPDGKLELIREETITWKFE